MRFDNTSGAKSLREVYRVEHAQMRDRVFTTEQRKASQVAVFYLYCVPRTLALCAYGVIVLRRYHRFLVQLKRIRGALRRLMFTLGRWLRGKSRPGTRQSQFDENLAQALESNNEINVRAFLDRGANPSLLLATGAPAIVSAVRSRNTGIADVLLSSGASANTVDPSTGHSLLRIALNNKDIAVSKLLLQHGASVDEHGVAEITCLMQAAALGLVDFVRIYLDNGADPTIRCLAYDARYFAALRNRTDVIALLDDALRNQTH